MVTWIMELHFKRGPELQSQQRLLPASIYNKLHILFARTGQKALFIPIRSLQYLAVIDAEEVVFIDGMNRHDIELAWQNFRPQQRNNLRAAVGYRWVCYSKKILPLEQRMQTEFYKALMQRESKQPASAVGIISPLTDKKNLSDKTD